MPARASSGGSARKKAPGRSAARKRMPDGPIAFAFTMFGQFLLVLWKLVAHTVGGGARAVGRGARDLDPDLRRDGVGLLLLAVGVLIAAAVWWQSDGLRLEYTRLVTMGGSGNFSPILPRWFLPMAVKLMRTPTPGKRAGGGALRLRSAAI